MLEGARVHTTLPAMDIERAKAFYAKKVGATAGDSSPGGTFFMFGESRFVIYPTSNPNRGGHTQMGISVKDVGAAVRELRGRGVTFEEYDMPGLKTVDGIATHTRRGRTLAACRLHRVSVARARRRYGSDDELETLCAHDAHRSSLRDIGLRRRPR